MDQRGEFDDDNKTNAHCVQPISVKEINKIIRNCKRKNRKHKYQNEYE